MEKVIAFLRTVEDAGPYGFCANIANVPKIRLPPGGRDALRKYAGGIFLAKAGSKLCLRPGPKAGAVGD